MQHIARVIPQVGQGSPVNFRNPHIRPPPNGAIGLSRKVAANPADKNASPAQRPRRSFAVNASIAEMIFPAND